MRALHFLALTAYFSPPVRSRVAPVSCLRSAAPLAWFPGPPLPASPSVRAAVPVGKVRLLPAGWTRKRSSLAAVGRTVDNRCTSCEELAVGVPIIP